MAIKGDNNNNNLKPFWRKDGSDYIADLGIMKKAIVVSYYIGGYYSISTRSFFPFESDYYLKKFKKPEDCCIYAENYIIKWFNSLLINPENKLIIEETNKKLN